MGSEVNSVEVPCSTRPVALLVTVKVLDLVYQTAGSFCQGDARKLWEKESIKTKYKTPGKKNPRNKKIYIFHESGFVQQTRAAKSFILSRELCNFPLSHSLLILCCF